MPKRVVKENKGDVLRADKPSTEDLEDAALRPTRLAEFLGQKKIKDNLSVFIQAARQRGEALDHVFLIGPPGLGKTTLAHIIANEMGVAFLQTHAVDYDQPKDLLGKLTSLPENSVIFIDEIHRLKKDIMNKLLSAMEDYIFGWTIGEGAAARAVTFPLKRFTMVGATTEAGRVSAPMRSRFGITCSFQYYEAADMELIVRRSAKLLGIRIEDNAAALLASSARSTPRVANRLLKRVRDFAQVAGSQVITRPIVADALERMEIDGLGLERNDREILRLIIERYGGGPVGAETLAISIGESADTLEDYYEPYLIQVGLLQRTPRGRMATSLAYRHLGLSRQSDSLFNPVDNSLFETAPT
jgi:Holliday junction DNA helicase RuvB